MNISKIPCQSWRISVFYEKFWNFWWKLLCNYDWNSDNLTIKRIHIFYNDFFYWEYQIYTYHSFPHILCGLVHLKSSFFGTIAHIEDMNHSEVHSFLCVLEYDTNTVADSGFPNGGTDFTVERQVPTPHRNFVFHEWGTLVGVRHCHQYKCFLIPYEVVFLVK